MQILGTSRISTDWSGADTIITIELEKWSTDESTSYLIKSSGKERLDLTDDKAKTIAETLDNLPLALSHAAAYLRENRAVTVASYCMQVSELLNEVPPGVDNDARSVFATFRQAIAQAEQQAPGAAAVCCLAAFFAPEDIPEELFLQRLEGSEDLRPTLTDAVTPARDLRSTIEAGELDVDEAIGALDRLSLITFSAATRTFSLHRLVQAAGRDLLGDAALPWVQSAVAAVDAAFPPGDIEFAAWPTCQRLLAHARAALDGLPANVNILSAARLANQCGLYLDGRAAFAEAEPLYRRALAIDESYGPHYLGVGIRLHNLACLLRATNRLVEAEPLIRRALVILEMSYGPDHPLVADVLMNLASLLQDTNRLAEAEPLFRRALAIDEASRGPDHPDVARALNNLAELLYATNRLAEAEPLWRRALAIDEANYGPNHPKIAKRLNHLAMLLHAANRLAEVEPLARHALAIDEASYEPGQPDIARDLTTLAELLRATDRLAEAEPLARRALAIDEASYGPGHPAVARDLTTLAELLRAANQLAEAEPLLRRALAIDEASYGPQHPYVAIRLNNLAQLLQATDRLAEAEPLLRRALAIDEASYS